MSGMYHRNKKWLSTAFDNQNDYPRKRQEEVICMGVYPKIVGHPQMSNVQNPYDIPLYSLVNRDPHIGLL